MAEQYLPMQIAGLHFVFVQNCQSANARSCEHKRSRTAEPSQTHEKNLDILAIIQECSELSPKDMCPYACTPVRDAMNMGGLGVQVRIIIEFCHSSHILPDNFLSTNLKQVLKAIVHSKVLGQYQEFFRPHIGMKVLR